MSGFPILDLVIGIIFIYFLLSIICSSAVELWFSIRSTRARLLEKWLKQIFNIQALDSNGFLKLQGNQPISLGQEIMNHCMVTALSKTGKSTSYIDAENFVSALLDKITLTPAAPGVNSVQLPPADLTGYITAISNSTVISGELKRTILSFAYQAKAAVNAIKTIPAVANVTTNISTTIKSDIDHFRERLENWYDTNSDRLTGTFKRKKTLPSTFILATIITISMNVDTIEISKYLYNNKDASKQLASTAIDTYQKIDSLRKGPSADKSEQGSIDALNQKASQLKQYVDSVQSLNLPIGWKSITYKNGTTFWDYFFQWGHIAGWLATIFAILMGAPFWFDLLNKIANLRGTGPKPVVAKDDNK